MSKSICGANCDNCGSKENCAGCKATNGKPFGVECMLAHCCMKKGHTACETCTDTTCGLKAQLMKEFNELGIEGMGEITELYALTGAFVNLEYEYSNGQRVKLLEDNKIYLGNQIEKPGSDRCIGIVGDENYLLVCEYGEHGANPEIILYQKRNK